VMTGQLSGTCSVQYFRL